MPQKKLLKENLMILRNKNAFITGGSRGIGKSIALEFARKGANVAFSYISSDEVAELTCKEIRKYGVESYFFKAHVSVRKDMQKVFSILESKWKSLDILVNNAGINKPTDFDEIKDDDWDDIISTNLKGPFVCSQLAIPLLKKTKNASIINISSVSGQYGGPRTAHYAASKAGLISLSQVIARFGAKYGIRSNSIAAGLIESEMAASGLTSGSVSKAAESIILGKLGTFEDVSKAATFLASDDSNYITAQTLNVNGGLYF